MDFIVSLPKNRHKKDGVLKVVYRLSKITTYANTKDIYELNVAKSLKDHVYRHHGFPKKIISDRDAIFISRIWRTLLKLL